MTKVDCGKGHIYDADMYSSCPYCNGFQTVDFGSVPVGAGGATMPGDVPVGTGGVTMPAGGGLYDGGQRSVMDEVNKTLPPKGYEMRVDTENKTVGAMKNDHGFEPVVGWLVCIEGKERGRDYRLFGRINTVGRGENMDVCVRGDCGITRDAHFRVAYDPKNNGFHIIPGNGSNNTYLNNEPIYMQAKLNAYDLIEVSSTKLVFIPLCEQRFTWSGGLNERGAGDAAT